MGQGSKQHEVVVVGGGPCGSAAAWAAARSTQCGKSGRQVLLLERAQFPRTKVCGDCLNPALQSSLREMGLGAALGLDSANTGKADAFVPLARCRRVEFHHGGPHPHTVTWAAPAPAEIVVQRRYFDELLLQTARRAGVEVRERIVVEGIIRTADGWCLRTSEGEIRARCVIAADGRNSVVARSLQLLPPGGRDRVGWQRHLPLPERLRETIAMFFLPSGYGGLADCGGGFANLCLVAAPSDIRSLCREVAAHFSLPEEVAASGGSESWQTITPIRRAPARSLAGEGLFLAGDAARVVEPFTGEGIYYAVRSGLLAGKAASREMEITEAGTLWYEREHRALYRGRVWVNQLSRWAGEHAHFTGRILRLPGVARFLLPALTKKVLAPA